MSPSLNKHEKIAGFCYLPFYLVLLPFLIALVSQLLGLNISPLAANVCYYAINLLFIIIVYRQHLVRSFRNIRFWDLVQALILGFVLYYAGNRLLDLLLSLLNLHPTSYNDEAVNSLVQANRWIMIICTIVIAPVVEEMLVRGLVFGTIRKKNRILAYVVSLLLFSLMHVWSYIPTEGLLPVLTTALFYFPGSVALAWTYEKGRNIWASIFLHAAINALVMFL